MGSISRGMKYKSDMDTPSSPSEPGQDRQDSPAHRKRKAGPICSVHSGAGLLPQLHVVGGEQPVPALAHPAPPAVVNHLDVGDDVIGVE